MVFCIQYPLANKRNHLLHDVRSDSSIVITKVDDLTVQLLTMSMDRSIVLLNLRSLDLTRSDVLVVIGSSVDSHNEVSDI